MPDMWMNFGIPLAEVPVNIMPLIDDTDFKTRETAIAYNAAGMDLVWNFADIFGAFTQTAVTPTTAGVHDWTHQGDGMYTLEIPVVGGTINNDTEGFGWFTGVADGVLPWRGPVIGIRPGAINNALIEGSDELDVNVIRISGDSAAANNLEADYDGTGYAKTNSTIGTCTTNTDMRGTDNAATATALATVDGIVDSILEDTGTTIPAQITALNDPTAATIAAAVWDALQASHVTAGSFGEMATEVAAILADTGTDIPATLTTIANYIDTEVAAILEDTGTTLPAQISALNNISVADIMAGGNIDGYTLEQAQKLQLAALAGVLAGAGTTTITIEAANGSKTRITATVDTDGNRSAVTLDGT